MPPIVPLPASSRSTRPGYNRASPAGNRPVHGEQSGEERHMPQNVAAKKVLDAVRNEPGQRVKVAVSDIDGVLRGKYLHKDKFFSAAEGGFGFCDVVFGWDMTDHCYDNTTVTGWHKGYPDALARI